MEKDKSVYNGILIATGVTIAFMLLLIITVDLGEHTESLALALDNVAELPKSITLGESYSFSFSLENLLSEEQDVVYLVILELDGSQSTIAEGSISLDPESDANESITFEINDSFNEGKIIIIANDLEIYFSLEMEQDES